MSIRAGLNYTTLVLDPGLFDKLIVNRKVGHRITKGSSMGIKYLEDIDKSFLIDTPNKLA